MNNKGITLIEIIISVSLISLVLVLLFSLLIQVKDINGESTINSSYLINKALVIKNVEDDISVNYDGIEKNIEIKKCCVKDFLSDYVKKEGDVDFCISFTFNEGDTGYLAMYRYSNNAGIYEDYKDQYLISYIHNEVLGTRLMTNYRPTLVRNVYNFNESASHDAFVLNIPIIGPDGKDYSINIPYYGKYTWSDVEPSC